MVIYNWDQKLTLQALDLHPSLSRECLVHFLDSLERSSIACNASFLVSAMANWLFQVELEKSRLIRLAADKRHVHVASTKREIRHFRVVVVQW